MISLNFRNPPPPPPVIIFPGVLTLDPLLNVNTIFAAEKPICVLFRAHVRNCTKNVPEGGRLVPSVNRSPRGLRHVSSQAKTDTSYKDYHEIENTKYKTLPGVLSFHLSIKAFLKSNASAQINAYFLYKYYTLPFNQPNIF